jgi:hypothetical protein
MTFASLPLLFLPRKWLRGSRPRMTTSYGSALVEKRASQLPNNISDSER